MKGLESIIFLPINPTSGLFKPLFSPNLLVRLLTGFTPTLSPELAAIAEQWARTAADPAFLNLNEKPLQGQFLTDIFAHLLGFAPAADLPPDIAADAFDWRAAFPQVFEDGGFDCVVGNPPYIRQEWLGPCKPAFEREFRCYAGTADSYLYFIERGLDVLCPGGRLGFITSGTFNNANFAAPFRAWLPTVARFLRSVNFG